MNKHILLIDSEPRWAAFVRNDLHDYNLIVLDSIDGVWELLGQTEIELIIISSRFVRFLPKLQELYPDIPVLVATIYTSLQEARDVYKNGALQYFSKSFSTRNVYDRVQKFVSSSH